MKKLLAAGLTVLSMSAFSQSYLILNNGITLTTDKPGYVYDFGHFNLPYKVNITGGQFFVADEKLSTVDAQGYLYEKDEKIKKIKGKGLNYVVNDKSDILTIAANGFYYKYEKDDAVKNIKSFGGNFFISQKDRKTLELYTVNNAGNYYKMNIPGLNPADIAVIGSTFFITQSGLVHTVSKEGFVFPKPGMIISGIKNLGGNFLIDSRNALFTISDAGILANPVLPLNLKINNIIKVGSNYMLDSDGRIFVVDMNGNIAERTISNHNLKDTKVISL